MPYWDVKCVNPQDGKEQVRRVEAPDENVAANKLNKLGLLVGETTKVEEERLTPIRWDWSFRKPDFKINFGFLGGVLLLASMLVLLGFVGLIIALNQYGEVPQYRSFYHDSGDQVVFEVRRLIAVVWFVAAHATLLAGLVLGAMACLHIGTAKSISSDEKA